MKIRKILKANSFLGIRSASNRLGSVYEIEVLYKSNKKKPGKSYLGFLTGKGNTKINSCEKCSIFRKCKGPNLYRACGEIWTNDRVMEIYRKLGLKGNVYCYII